MAKGKRSSKMAKGVEIPRNPRYTQDKYGATVIHSGSNRAERRRYVAFARTRKEFGTDKGIQRGLGERSKARARYRALVNRFGRYRMRPLVNHI